MMIQITTSMASEFGYDALGPKCPKNLYTYTANHLTIKLTNFLTAIFLPRVALSLRTPAEGNYWVWLIGCFFMLLIFNISESGILIVKCILRNKNSHCGK